MPRLSRWLIKAGFLNLLFALVLQFVRNLPRVARSADFLMTSQPAQIHLFVLGWVTQVIFGVAFWMFPRYSRENPYGPTSMGWMGFVLLNAGLLMRLVAEPMEVLQPAAGWEILLLFSAFSQAIAGTFFVILIWPRVKLRA